MRSGVRIPHGAPLKDELPTKGSFFVRKRNRDSNPKGLEAPAGPQGPRGAATRPMSLAKGKAANPSRRTRISAGQTPYWVWPFFRIRPSVRPSFDNVPCSTPFDKNRAPPQPNCRTKSLSTGPGIHPATNGYITMVTNLHGGGCATCEGLGLSREKPAKRAVSQTH